MTSPPPAQTERLAAPLAPASSAGSLLIYHRNGTEIAPAPPDVAVVVGRQPPADVVVADSSLSRSHARITVTAAGMEVEDLGSTNGTWVNGERIQRATVRPGDELALGAVRIALHRPGGPGGGLDGHERLLERLEEEILRARTFRRGCSLLLIRGRGHLSRWSGLVQEALRPVDRFALYAASTLEILLPETEGEAALALARAALAASPEATAAALASYPQDATSAQGLIAAATAALHRAAPGEVALPSRQAPPASGEIALSSEPMRRLDALIQRIAPSDITVLLHGETGTGKEVIARRIHARSPRGQRPMIALNCAAIPENLVESTLFGHERGSFTGATAAASGVFGEAEGSTVFLDEVGELPPAVQAALLRVLEVRRITRVGSSREIPVDVRIIAASHRDLADLARQGRFRQDLLYRLNAVTVQIPPLRERPEDVAALARCFLQQASAALRRPVSGLEPAALERLLRHAWPGNVRELRNVLERAVILAEGAAITPEDLPPSLGQGAPAAPAPALAPDLDFKERVQRFERDLLLEGLRAAGGNQTRAAELLGIPRRTLIHKMQAYGIRHQGYAASEEA